LSSFSPPFASADAIRAHPRFDAAFEVFVDEMAAVYAQNTRMSGLSDFRQGVCFQLLVCFDASRDPDRPETLFTTEGVVRAMAMMGVQNRRAVSDLIGRLRDDGYVIIEPAAHDRRVRELRATDKAREADREWLQVLHLPMTILKPDEERFQLGARRDPAYQYAFRSVSLQHLPQASQVMAGNPEADYFVQQRLGARIMMTLMQAVRGRADRRTDPGFYAWAADQCGVSPPHIRKVMRGAEERGLVVLTGTAAVTVEVTPAMEESVRRWTAACLSATDLTSRSAWSVLTTAGPA
jgi:DNA-binding MarR family transcriptional regulator